MERGKTLRSTAKTHLSCKAAGMLLVLDVVDFTFSIAKMATLQRENAAIVETQQQRTCKLRFVFVKVHSNYVKIVDSRNWRWVKNENSEIR